MTRLIASLTCAAALLLGACGDDDGHGGDPPPADSGTTGAAAAFCDSYEATCGFGAAERFVDADDCVSAYQGFAATRQSCVELHVGLASSDPATHCPHATGQAPCN